MSVKKCHDCDAKISSGDQYMPYTVGEDEYAKCKDCYKKDPILRGFQETEVYSRVVGYIRPVQQWNKGKKEEYKDRKEFVAEGCSC